MKMYYIREYDSFIKESQNIRLSDKYIPMEDKTFDELEQNLYYQTKIMMK